MPHLCWGIEQQSDAAEPFLERKGFALELDAIVPEDLGSDISLRRFLQVWITKLKHNLWVAYRETIRIRNPTPKYEPLL